MEYSRAIEIKEIFVCCGYAIYKLAECDYAHRADALIINKLNVVDLQAYPKNNEVQDHAEGKASCVFQPDCNKFLEARKTRIYYINKHGKNQQRGGKRKIVTADEMKKQ